MPIDTTPSTVATSALQAIPFPSLIGGPLDACIQAQARAAKTTWDFIQAVGLNVDSTTGDKKAINVVFQYQKTGQMVNLIVPLLTIVPIPYIAVSDITIDFKANISAAASTVETESTSEELGAGLTVGGTFWGVTVNFNANYSSKKDSSATRESKYSVEYTMDVHVEAGQESMPAGLAAVLNILQSSITSADTEGEIKLDPITPKIATTAASSVIQAMAIGKDGVAVADQPITFSLLKGKGLTIEKIAVAGTMQGDPTDSTTDPILIEAKVKDGRAHV